MDKKLRLCIFLLFIGFAFFAVFTLLRPVVTAEEGKIFYLNIGMSKKSFIKRMQAEGLIQYPFIFSLYTYTSKDASLKAGEYIFPYGASLWQIWRQVTQGKGIIYHPFTIVPGWSFRQLRHHLDNEASLKHLTTNLNEAELMSRLGAKALTAEGQFFPETYYYSRGSSDLTILKRAYDLMQKRLEEAWKDRAPTVPYSEVYSALIAASLIEKEAFLENERSMIAGVIVNRLRNGMLLQIDPTVIYGLGARYTGKLHKEDLSHDSPYNTYLYKGLPPTPIAYPSMASIHAALHPVEKGYVYFVARGDGGHHFSRSLKEHNAAIKIVNYPEKPADDEFFNKERVKYLITRMFYQPRRKTSAFRPEI